MKQKPILGVDGSSKSYAYAVVKDNKLIDYGELPFDGDDEMPKLGSARKQADKIANMYDYHKAYVESTVYVNNRAVVIMLAHFSGVVYSSLVVNKVGVEKVAPINWQRHIGNGPWTKAERAKIKKDNPGKSKSWLSSERRRMRKQRTMDYINDRFGVDIDNDNIGDAIAIAAYGWDKEYKNG